MAQIPWDILSQLPLSKQDANRTILNCIEELNRFLSPSSLKLTQALTQIQLSLLQDDSEDHFRLIQAKGTVQIHPQFITDLNKGIFTYLSRFLNRFIPEFKGLWVGFRNCIPLETTGQTLDSEPLGLINLNIKIECLVLSPFPDTFIGTVSQIRPRFIGLLVYGFFNAIIRRREIPSQYIYTKKGYQHCDSKHTIVENTVLRFKILRLQCSPSGDIHSISGSVLDQENTGILPMAS